MGSGNIDDNSEIDTEIDADTYDPDGDAAHERSLALAARREAIAVAERAGLVATRAAEYAEQARAAVALASRAPAELPTIIERRTVVERATVEAEVSPDRALARRDRERHAFDLYASLRSSAEIIASLVEVYAISEATARRDLDRAKAIAGSWRDSAGWDARRDQHLITLRAMFHEARKDGDIDQARKLMYQIAEIEGFRAPTRGVVLHGHGMVQDSTMPVGPGYVAGVDVRSMTRAERAALLLLLPSEKAALGEGMGGDTSTVVDAVGTEIRDDDPQGDTQG